MKSMTGYGRAKQELHGRTITAELRAVNHRYLDCTVKAPRQYGFLDDAVKKAAAARIARGKVEVYIGVETQEGGDIAVTVNHAVAEHYLAALHELADKYGITLDTNPDGQETLTLDMSKWTEQAEGIYAFNCGAEAGGLTVETNLTPVDASDQSSEAVQQQVFILQNTNS